MHTTRYIKFKNAILDIVFPRRCINCEILLPLNQYHWICSSCLANIEYSHQPQCAFCTKITINGTTCYKCIKEHHLDQLFVLGRYTDPILQKTIKNLKYNFIEQLAFDLEEHIAIYVHARITPIFNNEKIVIIPVPLHRLRNNWRGFNQSSLLAGIVAKHTSWEIKENILIKNIYSQPQAMIEEYGTRIKTIQNTFDCKNPESIKNKTILLIDDVSTTGATLNDCARALKDRGAKKVLAFVLARG